MIPSKKRYIAVVDYGLGNLRSVAKAIEEAGAEAVISSQPKVIDSACAVVLPGVGAFSRGMENLNKSGLIKVILKSVQDGKPFLGICLGLQLLFEKSYEHKLCKGLGLIKGEVDKLSGKIKIPHMGWNTVKLKSSPLFKGVPDNSYFYFVHSYAVEPKDKQVIISTTDYGKKFTSGINYRNIFGVQFHPEKSGALGLKVLKNFVNLIDKA
jgi:imidazole glycerol-phosphate synthase subunit HisH